jgi:predicted PurR-regulated permease PerM
LAASAIVGVLYGFSLLLLGLPFPIDLGIVTAILDVIPLVGPTLMIPLVFVLGPTHFVLVAGIAGVTFFAIGQLDAEVLTPLGMGQVVSLAPFVTVLAIPLGTGLFGLVGALLSIPVAAALQVLVHEVLLPWLDARERSPRPPPSSVHLLGGQGSGQGNWGQGGQNR